jgi:hypothetical protein
MTPPKDPTSTTRQNRLKAARAAAGLVRVEVWVPEKFKDAVRAFAASLKPKDSK